MAKNGVKVYLDVEHEEILTKINQLKQIDRENKSGLIRFIILDYYELLTNKNSKLKSEKQDKQLNGMGQDISAILNLMCVLVKDKQAYEHIRNEDVLLYWKALEYTKSIINQDKTKNIPPPKIKEAMQTKTINQNYLQQLENQKQDMEFDAIFDVDDKF